MYFLQILQESHFTFDLEKSLNNKFITVIEILNLEGFQFILGITQT